MTDSSVPVAPHPGTHELTLPIEGMTCASCVSRVERVLGRVPGVAQVHVNLATERAALRLDREVAREVLVEAVENAGYRVGEPPLLTTGQNALEARNRAQTEALSSNVWLAAAFSLPVIVLEMGSHWIGALHHWVDATLGQSGSWLMQLLLTSLVMVWPGREIFVHGLRSLWRRSPDMNSLVALGTSSAFAYSATVTFALTLRLGPLAGLAPHVYFEAAAVVVTLILLGRYLEAKAKGRTSQAIARLVKLSPDVALVKRDEQWVEVPTRSVVKGDLLLLKPGARLAVDGLVESGESRIDESMLTGEPVPVLKRPGDAVRAGTVNQSGSLTMRATAIAEHTVLAQIVRMVEQAQAGKLPIQALVDQVTAWFVPTVMALAALTFGLWLAFGPAPALPLALVNSVSVLIIACPCAMGLATPTSILVGTGRGAELGLLFRHGEALQRLQETNVVAMDKTGTLTAGRPELTDWCSASGFDRDTVLAWVAAVESRSEHPIARAVVVAAQRQGLVLSDVTGFETAVGLGVSAQVLGRRVVVGSPRYLESLNVALDELAAELARFQNAGKTTLAVAIDGGLAAVFAVSDPIKPSAEPALRLLRTLGVRVAMITGDNQATAHAVAASLGIEHVVAEVLPAGKVAALAELRKRYGTVAFVGDGINDAPVLVEADVGIAMGTGTDIAIEAAQVVLMRDDLTAVATAIGLSRATLRNIRQNLFWAFAYNAALIPLAAGVLYPSWRLSLSPMLAGLAMAASSVFVLGNALRLRRFSPTFAQLADSRGAV